MPKGGQAMRIFIFVRVLTFVATLGLTFAWLTPDARLKGEQTIYKPFHTERKISYRNPNGQVVDLVLVVGSSAQKIASGSSWQVEVENLSPMTVRLALKPLKNKGGTFDKNDWDGWLTLEPLDKLWVERKGLVGDVEAVVRELQLQVAEEVYILGRVNIYQPKAK